MTDRRTEIVAAALSLVQADGLAGLTQPRVAARLGLRQSHVTYYFPTRDDLIAAVAESAVRERITALDAVRSARTLPRKLDVLAAVLIDPAQTRVLVALTQIADNTPALRSHFRALAEGITPAALSLLRAAGAAPSPEAVALLQTTSTGLAVLALATGRTDPTPLTAGLAILLASLPRSGKASS